VREEKEGKEEGGGKTKNGVRNEVEWK